MANDTDTNQTGLIRDDKGRIIGGKPPAGFDKHPENRHNGSWKKEDTPRFKLEQMMKLSDKELQDIAADDKRPLFEQKLAFAIKKGQWKEIREMIHEIYGKPQERIDHTSGGQAIKTALVEFIDEPSQDTDTD